MATKPSVLVTGVCGALGSRLVRQLTDFQVIGTDIAAPAAESNLFRFEKIDLGEERSCDQLLDLLRAYGPDSVVHLGFVDSPSQTRALDPQALWAINVAGTSRVTEAIAEHNRLIGGIEQFVFPSSAAVYGPTPELPVHEDASLNGQGLPYILQQKEADLTVQSRAVNLRHCKTYILRPHVYAGGATENHLLAVLRGHPGTGTFWGEHLRRRNSRLSLLLPSKGEYLEHKFQFLHVDDMARLLAHIVRRRRQGEPQLTILNVAGRGDPLSLRRCTEIAQIRVKLLPTLGLCRWASRFFWEHGISQVPPEMVPYLLGSCVLETTQLRVFLGEEYRAVIQHTSEEALTESFASVKKKALQVQLT